MAKPLELFNSFGATNNRLAPYQSQTPAIFGNFWHHLGIQHNHPNLSVNQQQLGDDIMASDEFQPKLGCIRSVSGRKNQKYLNRIIRDIRRTAQPKSRNSRSTFSGSQSGRGYSVAASQRDRSFQPGRRRVIIKARFTKIKSGDLGAARAHLRYIQRDGVTREGEPGELYGRDNDHVDGKSFLEGTEDDRHQFRFIVAPEDSAQLEDLKPFIRDLMQQKDY